MKYFGIKITSQYNLEYFCEKYQLFVKKLVKDNQLKLRVDFAMFDNLTRKQIGAFNRCCKETFADDTSKKLKSEKIRFSKRKWKRKFDYRKRVDRMKSHVLHNQLINTFTFSPPFSYPVEQYHESPSFCPPSSQYGEWGNLWSQVTPYLA